MTSLTISANADLPGICALCGLPSESTLEFRDRTVVGGESGPIRWLLAILSPIMYMALRSELGGARREMTLRLPVCGTCRRDAPPIRPKFVDHEHKRFVFIVHTALAEAIAESREQAGAGTA